MNNTLAANLARRVLAIENCRVNAKEAQDQRGRQYWIEKKIEHETAIASLLENYMPSGGGFDSGWYLDPNNIPPDQQYYTKHANKRVAHWTI